MPGTLADRWNNNERVNRVICRPGSPCKLNQTACRETQNVCCLRSPDTTAFAPANFSLTVETTQHFEEPPTKVIDTKPDRVLNRGLSHGS